jgi:hypothetical protein
VTPQARRGGLVFLLAALGAASVVARQAPAAWPHFRGTPGLTGVASSALPLSLRLQWTYEAGARIESSAAIADGIAFVGTLDGNLLAVDLTTGRTRWTYQIEALEKGND